MLINAIGFAKAKKESHTSTFDEINHVTIIKVPIISDSKKNKLNPQKNKIMKTTFIILFLCFLNFNNIGFAQKIKSEWVKNPSTNFYSLQHDQEIEKDLIKEKQRKLYKINELMKIANDLKSEDEGLRINAVDLLSYTADIMYLSKIEEMLQNDSSAEVKYQCARSIHRFNSKSSIPFLIMALQINDNQLKMEIALALAALGEKTECLKIFEELTKIGERNFILDAHLGYLDLATVDAVDNLKNDLPDNDPYISVDAAIILAQLGYFKESYPTLKSKLLHQDKYVRMASLRGLAYSGTNNAIKLIKGEISDTNLLVRERALLILKNCNIPIMPKSNIKSAKTAYNSTASTQYGNTWCNSRNPAYYDYSNSGGDCANFVSQCLIAGYLDLSPGINDGYGCIPSCDNLHTFLYNNSNVTYYQRLYSSYPSWWTKGDVIMMGITSDPWQHAMFAATTNTPPLLDAHTTDRCQYSLSTYPPSSYTSCDFYHINSSIVTLGNDNCPGYSLSVNSSCSYTNGTTVGATSTGFTTCSGNMNDDDVFYYFNTGSYTSVTIQVQGLGNFDPAVQVLSGACGGSQYQITNGCIDVTAHGGLESRTFTGLSTNTTYYIRIGSYDAGTNNQGSFQVCVYGTANLPDLIITAGTQSANPSSVNAGSSITAYCSEDNIGTGISGSNSTRLYLSVDGVLNTSTDTYLGSITGFPSLAPNSCSVVKNAVVTIPSGTAPGSYYLFFWADGNGDVTESIENNNFASTIITVTCNTPSPATSISGNSSVCSGFSTTLTATGTLTTGATWKWYSGSCGGTYIGNGSSITVSPTVNTTYYLRAESSVCGNSSCVSKTIAVTTAPTISGYSNPSSICSGQSITLNASGASSYTWSGNGLQSSSGSSVIAIPTTTGTNVYTVTGTSNGCSSTNTVNVTVNATPLISANSNPSSICLGQSTTLNVSGASSYTWAGNGLQSSSGASVTAMPTTTGTNTYTVIGTSNGCNGTGTAIVTINPNVTPSVTLTQNPPNPVCSGQAVTISANPTNGGSNPIYSFSGGIGTTIGNQYMISSLTSNATINCTMTSNIQCPSTATVNNSINLQVTNPLPASVNIAIPATNICLSDIANFSAVPSNGGNSPTFSWFVNGLVVGSGSIFSYSFPSTGMYTVYCVMTSSDNCVSGSPATSNQLNITVQNQVTAAVTINSASSSVCQGDSITFNAIPGNGGNNPSYQWKVNGTTVSTGSSTFIISTLNNGDVVSCTMTSNSLCVTSPNANSNSITVTVYPLPTAIALGDTTVCPGVPVPLIGSGGVNCSWLPANGLSSSTTCDPIATVNSTTTYTLTVSDIHGCSNQDHAVITIIPPISPTASFSIATNTPSNPGFIGCFTNTSINSTSVKYDFGDPASGSMNISNIDNPCHYFSSNSIYIVTMTAYNGCGLSLDSNVTQSLINGPSGISELTDEAILNVFPNPSNGVFTIEIFDILDGGASLKIFDVIGQIIYDQNIQQFPEHQKIPINIAKQSKGVYFITLQTSKGKFFRKIIFE